MIHIHSDVENLRFFSDKNGVSAFSHRAIAYAMQESDIVQVFYSVNQAQRYMDENMFKSDLTVIYFWDENRWNNRN